MSRAVVETHGINVYKVFFNRIFTPVNGNNAVSKYNRKVQLSCDSCLKQDGEKSEPSSLTDVKQLIHTTENIP